MKKIMQYIGKGKGVIPGVPARDLDYKEVLAAGGFNFLISTGLYEPIEQPKPKRHYKIKNDEDYEKESDE